MKLPDSSIGISDLLAYRECPRRFSYGMRRHTARGEQSDDRTPEARSPQAAYGSAIHDAIAATEDAHSDEAAIEVAWKRWGARLEPSDIQLLRDDLAIYRTRDFPNTRTVLAEDEIRVPLMTWQDERIFFRARIDRLYERLDAPGTFIHVDYKSSKWAKSDLEVQDDLQMWAYNWAIGEFFPEIDQLHQVYDQLRYGQIPTHKTPAQRAQIREWLVKQTTAVLTDDDVRGDELLAPTYNRWCPWCPILESCPVVEQLSDFALTRLAALAPVEPITKKDGTPSKKTRRVPLDPARAGEYAAQLEKAKLATAVLERFEESVKELLRDMPDERRAQLGYELRDRRNSVFTPRAAQALHEQLGERFYEVVKLTKTGLQSALAQDEDLLEWALGLADQVAGPTLVVKAA